MRALIYGLALSIALGAVTSSLGGALLGNPLVSDLQTAVAIWAALLAGILWAAGAAWGVRAFSFLQRTYNIAGERV
jgi:hypothetical protein